MANSIEHLQAAGEQWHVAKEQERIFAGVMYDAIRLAVHDGLTEVAAAEIAGVDRMTVRRALGKL